MNSNGTPISYEDLAEEFANMFEKKIADTVSSTPIDSYVYKHAIQLFKLFNSTNMSDDWITLNNQQNFYGRNGKISNLQHL